MFPQPNTDSETIQGTADMSHKHMKGSLGALDTLQELDKLHRLLSLPTRQQRSLVHHVRQLRTGEACASTGPSCVELFVQSMWSGNLGLVLGIPDAELCVWGRHTDSEICLQYDTKRRI